MTQFYWICFYSYFPQSFAFRLMWFLVSLTLYYLLLSLFEEFLFQNHLTNLLNLLTLELELHVQDEGMVFFPGETNLDPTSVHNV